MGFQIKSFSTIRLSVRSVSQSCEWYCTLFDVEPIERSEKFASLKIGGANFDVSLADQLSPLSTGGSIGYWLVDDLDDLLVKVKELGGSVYRGPLNVSEIQRTIVQIKDPFGNVVGFEAPL